MPTKYIGYVALLLLMQLIPARGVAQTTVKGIVLDSITGEGLPFVSVLLKGTNQGTTTDADGYFALASPSRSTMLVFSYLGYNEKLITLKSRRENNLKVSMAPTSYALNEVVIKPGKERSLFRRHPWIFEGSIERLVGRARPGDTVDVLAADGRPLARAAWSPKSQIRARVWSFDAQAIIDALQGILDDLDSGALAFDPACEDIHMFVEQVLTARIGDLGKKLHTARSRNDQVALDLRMYLRNETSEIIALTKDVLAALVEQAGAHKGDILPGYTHLQRAQPITFGHHLMAYAMMLLRDIDRMQDAVRRMNVSPIGCCALAGTTYDTDRFFEAKQLGFDDVARNSLDGVSDRDFCVELLDAYAIEMMHLSRLSEELVLWSSWEFQFVQLSDSYTTGSSIMPQKKNPDVPELARGKTGRVVGHLMGLITLMKGQPLAYNKDNQEDKEPLFDTVDTLKDTLRIFAEMVGGQLNPATGVKEGGITVNAQAMEDAAKKGYATATDLADYLVKKGLPFRDAHETVAHAVKAAQSHACDLSELPLAVLQGFHPAIEKDVYECLSLRGSLDARNTLGGTAPVQVRAQLARQRARLA
mgnify:CR=1 FL=1